MITGVDDGVPWVVEAAFACLPEGRSAAPALRRQLVARARTPAIRSASAISSAPTTAATAEPIVLFVHLICPRPEFLDRGKSSLAAHSPGFSAIREAVELVTADWAKQRKSEIRDQAREQKRLEKMRVEKPAPELSLKDLVLKHLPAAIRQISEDGRLSFTQRDVFYVLRPLVQDEHDKSLDYGYFTALITDYENERGEIPGMQREPRGTLYHPHLRQEIPLSTESVASYGRPFWTFNKLVYIEKAGTQQNLIEVGWPEEYDCRDRERRRLHHPRGQGSARPARHVERAGDGVLRP